MKITPFRREWISNRVSRYCSLLQVEPPRLILTFAEYDRWKKEKRSQSNYVRVGRGSSYLGVCHRNDSMIFLNVKRALNLRGLDDTIRHELIHYTKPSYNHYSVSFRVAMERLKQGKVKNGRFHK